MYESPAPTYARRYRAPKTAKSSKTGFPLCLAADSVSFASVDNTGTAASWMERCSGVHYAPEILLSCVCQSPEPAQNFASLLIQCRTRRIGEDTNLCGSAGLPTAQRLWASTLSFPLVAVLE